MKLPPCPRLIFISLVLVTVLAIIALGVYAFVIKAEAASILADVSRIKVGTSTLSDVEKLAERHTRHCRWTGHQGDRSDYSFEVRNTWLSYLRIKPAAKFDAWVTVNKGTVQSVYVDVMRDTRVFPTAPSGGMVEEYVKYPEYYRAGETHYGFPSPVGKPYLLVALDVSATAEQREHAYTLSLRCLVKPGGGGDLPCDYLPLAWKDWEAELKSEGWGFGNYYPRRARCN